MKKLTVRDVRKVELQLSTASKEDICTIQNKLTQTACSLVVQVVKGKNMRVRDAYNHCKGRYIAAYGHHWSSCLTSTQAL